MLSIEIKISYSLGNQYCHYKAFVLDSHFVNFIVLTLSPLDMFITRVPNDVVHYLIYSRVIICRGRMAKFCHVLQVTSGIMVVQKEFYFRGAPKMESGCESYDTRYSGICETAGACENSICS